MVCYPFRIAYACSSCAYLLVLLCSAFADIPSSLAPQVARELKPTETPAPNPSNVFARERIAFLRTEIARHDDLYFKQANPAISDFEYDRLKQELRDLEHFFPYIAKSLTTLLEIGDDRDGLFQTDRHETPMLSLRKAYSHSALQQFHKQVSHASNEEAVLYLIEPKIDGIAISLTYEQGNLVRALTRGNGLEGDDITANIMTIPSIPKKLTDTTEDGQKTAIPDRIEIRGEIFSNFSDFKAINRQRESRGESRFTHPRSLAAGSAKLSDPNQTAKRKLSVLFFGYGDFLPSSIVPKTQREFYQLAHSWGLPVLQTVRTAKGIDRLSTAINDEKSNLSEHPYPTDGLVVKVDLIALQGKLGYTNQAPRWALAYKFPPKQAETRLLSINIQVGRTGLLTPLAEFAPVSISGSTISRATLHNRRSISKLDLHIGDTIIIEKAGEIIPRIVSVDTSKRHADSTPYAFPDHCPSCSSAINLLSNEANLYCYNAKCPAQLQRRIEHFASSQCMNIDGLGPATIQLLIASKVVKDLPDLYKLESSKLLSPEKTNLVSTNKLLNSIERSKHADLWRVICGIGIPGIGKARANILAETIGSLESLSEISKVDFDGASEYNSIEAVTRRAILDYFSVPDNRTLVKQLILAGIQPSLSSKPSKSILSDKHFVLTGKLPTLSRQKATQVIGSLGGIVRDTITEKTDYLLLGTNPGSKLKEAQERNITIIDEAFILRLTRE
jgi:DNA ligase (NAD+)